MKNLWLACCVGMLAAFGSACDAAHSLHDNIREGVAGSGMPKSETRNVSNFTALETNGSFTLEIICEQQPSLTIEADDNLLPLIKTEVRGETLYLSTEKSINPKTAIHVRLTTNEINSLQLNGAAKLNVTQVKNASLTLKGEGASNVTLAGETQRFDAQLNGAGKLNAQDLRAADAKISVNGAGYATVFASGSLDASVNGAGAIDYYGNPANVTPHIGGIGKITKK